MKILITGHLGFVGGVMVNVLRRRGHNLIGIDSGLFHGCRIGGGREIVTVAKDLRRVSLDDLRGYDAVIHLAALPEGSFAERNQELTYEINYHATVRLARAAKETGVRRFLFASSWEVYGALRGTALEESPLMPLTANATAKAMSEEALSMLADESFHPTFLRLACVYGLSPRLRLDQGLNALAAWGYTTGSVPYAGDGRARLPIVHVEDACLAFAAALEEPLTKVGNRPFNVGSNAQNPVQAVLARLVAKKLGGCVTESFSAEGGPAFRVDFSRIGKELRGFRPSWKPTRALSSLRSAFGRIESPDLLRDPRFQPDRWLERLRLSGEVNAGLYRLRPLPRRETAPRARPAAMPTSGFAYPG